jgi:hypothetical protein
MKTIDQLVKGGSTQAAFKYKANAEKFIRAWEKKGYHVGWLRSSGPVVDADERVPNAYYVIAEKEAPKPFTKHEQREIAEYERLEKLSKSDPRKYWLTYVKPALSARNSQIDPEIKALVFELNENNQFTTSSCAGHGNGRGHVFIRRRMFNGNLVRVIMKKHGLTGITRDRKDYVSNDGERHAVYEFDPMGKPKRRN